MDGDFLCFEQTAGRRGTVDLEALLPALTIQVHPGSADPECLAPLLERKLHPPVEEAGIGCSNGSQWQFARVQSVRPIVLDGLALD